MKPVVDLIKEANDPAEDKMVNGSTVPALVRQ
jgi:hypothetical protein